MQRDLWAERAESELRGGGEGERLHGKRRAAVVKKEKVTALALAAEGRKSNELPYQAV